VLDTDAYREFVRALTDPQQLDTFRTNRLAEQVVPVALLRANQRWQVFQISPFELLRQWHELAFGILAFCMPVLEGTHASHSCVARCRNGEVQESLCSETEEDIANCFEATKNRCSPGGSAGDVTWIGSAPMKDAVTRPRSPERITFDVDYVPPVRKNEPAH
jgi:hypothetical protein